ncbi:tetratricopeptide repeat protein [Pseudozobellia thermophila]|uniref:Tetratricopeptide repeat-containing protein n=1 Tax=Pseudozobellia thermophila TaxID=192903 RepID=A0A1M6EDB6_9FLAO|nr:tetratricopeptide repeat protein [Pseudozobellia thermophila]SHI83379.1 Tetratricopeptide repeat-containing protein [Pseudozobellia thermophila]
MEPMTTAWMVSTLLGSWLGNRTDFWLCQGANKLYQRIKHTIDEPANHHIQRAIRKSYLQATLMAVNHILPQRKWYNLSNAGWDNIKELERYLKAQIDITDNENQYVKSSVLDESHREILFPKKKTSADRMDELIGNLKEGIIQELEGHGRRVELTVKTCIRDGWKDGGRNMDFYKLTCAFFTQELKETPELSTYIQTEYLDSIQTEIGEVNISVAELSQTLYIFFEEYKDVLPLLRKIHATLEEVKKDLGNLPGKTAQIVLQGIENHSITSRQLAISEEYQSYIIKIQEYSDAIGSINSQIWAVQVALESVDENTKSLLLQNLANLKRQLLLNSDKKNKTENTLNTFVSNVIELAQQLKRTTKLDSDRLENARSLFKEGKYRRLNEVLNEADIDHDIAEYEAKGTMLANELIIKAQSTVLLKEEGWFQEANRLFAKAMRLIENYNTTFNYAFFLQRHRQILQAEGVYEKALNHISNEFQKSTILNNLGLLQHDKNEYGRAEKSFGEALVIRRKLAEGDSLVYLPQVLTTLNSLANLQRDKKEHGKAEQSYNEALALLNKLAEVNPQTYLPKISVIQNNMGLLHSTRNEFDKAQQSYNEALAIAKKLADIDPQAYLPDVGLTLNNMALLYRKKNEPNKAEQCFETALFIMSKLTKLNPQTYFPDVAGILNNLGDLQRKKKELEQAERSIETALYIMRKLAEINPQTYLPQVAMTLNNLANLQVNKKELGKAELSYEEVLAMTRKFAKANPQSYLPNVAGILCNLANLQRDNDKFDKAQQSYEEALSINRKLAEYDPRVYEIPLADTKLDLSVFYLKYSIDDKKSRAYAKAALKLYTKYDASVPHAAQNGKVAQDILNFWGNGEI